MVNRGRPNAYGNDYFKYRYYESSMGRWLSPDPSQLAYADLENPQSLNLYNYVGNNPLTRADLDGLCWKGFQWACDLWNRTQNLVEDNGFHTDTYLAYHPSKKMQRKRQESYRRETRPAPSLPKPGTPGYIDVQLGPDPYLGRVTIGPRELTPMPPRLDPRDCVVPDAKGYHENAMLAWEKENGLPLSPSGPSDINGGQGVGATKVQFSGGSFYVGNTAVKLEPYASQTADNVNAEGDSGANAGAAVAAAFAEFNDCEGTR
jgi:RHS repeat-associated protein